MHKTGRFERYWISSVMDEEKRRPGRPRTRDEASSRRVYIGFAVPTPLKAALENAAEANRRSLSSEATSRLERSFDAPLPHDDVLLSLLLVSIYKRNGLSGLVRYLIAQIDDPNLEEQNLRALAVEQVLASLKPQIVPPKLAEPLPLNTFAFIEDEAGNRYDSAGRLIQAAGPNELTPEAKALLEMDPSSPASVERYMKARRRQKRT